MWERKLGLKLFRPDWKEIYTCTMKSLKYKKFAEFRYKVLLNILPCGERVHRFKSHISEYCVVCKEKENILHLLYECKRVKEIWKAVGYCLKVDIKPKHIILGFTDPHYVESNRNLCIVIIAYCIYATWCSCSFENTDYGKINLKPAIISYLSFYSDVYQFSCSNDVSSKNRHLKSIIDTVIFHLT